MARFEPEWVHEWTYEGEGSHLHRRLSASWPDDDRNPEAPPCPPHRFLCYVFPEWTNNMWMLNGGGVGGGAWNAAKRSDGTGVGGGLRVEAGWVGGHGTQR